MTQPTTEDLEASIQRMINEAKAIISGSSIKQSGQFFSSINDKESYMSALLNLLAISQPLPIQDRRSLATVLNMLLKDGLQYYDYSWTVQFMFKLVTEWRVPFAAKTMLHYGFSAILKHWNKELDNFFENVMIVLTNMVDVIRSNSVQECTPYQSEPIYTKLIVEPFIISFLTPNDLPQIYHTILFMLDCMLDNLTYQMQSKEYMLSLLAVLRKMQGIIINQETITQFPSLIKLNISVWQNLMDMVTDLTPSLNQCMEEVSQWHELTQLFQYIYRFKSQFMENDVANSLPREWYNYLHLTEQWENIDLLNLKKQIVNIHVRILALSDTNRNSLLVKQLHKIITDDLIPSLRYFSINRGDLAEYQINLGQAYLSLLWMIIHVVSVSDQWMWEMIQIILLPLLEFQMKTHRAIFEEDPKEFLKQIQNCCQQITYGGVLAQLSSVMGEMCERSDSIYQQLIKCLLHSLEINTVTHHSLSIERSESFLSKNAALFTLSILSYKTLNEVKIFDFFKNLITAEFYGNLDDYGKAYLYLFLSYSWVDIYQDSFHEGMYLWRVAMEVNPSSSLHTCALDFILNVCEMHYDKEFIFVFISRFAEISSQQATWEILQKITIRFITNFSQTMACEMVRGMRIQAEFYMNQQQNHSQECHVKVFRCLNICRVIARAQDYCRDKPSIQKELFLVTGMLTSMSRIRLDEDVVAVAGCLMDQFQAPPADFIALLDSVAETFRNYEFQGMTYFSFFSKYMQANFDPEICFKLYSIAFQGLFFFASYPDQRVDNDQSLNNHILLMQNYLLLHGDKLSERDLNDVLTASCEIFTRLFNHSSSQEREQIIRARNRNLHLICCRYLNLDLPMQQLLVESKQHVYRQYDALILVYILTKTPTAFFEVEEQSKLLQLVLNLLRTQRLSKSNSHGDKVRQMKRSEQLKKFNKILCNMNQPVQLELTLQRSINVCLKTLMDQGCRLEQTLKMMDKKDSEELRQLLRAEQQGLRLPQKTRQIKDRKILRVVGKKERPDIAILNNAIMKKIRNKPAIVNSSDSEEESNFEGQKKRKLSQSRRDKSRSERCMEKMLKKLEKQ